ncbi:MAG: hypothetical protein WDO24_20065 [Pseudomonadota bacterium]
MLGVEQRLAAALHGIGDRLADHLDILGPRDAERGVDMEIPGLADQAQHRPPRC